jgi:hypothetical protein
MTQTSKLSGACGLIVSCLASSAAAASLQPVSNWAKSAVPSDVSMYEYVPDDVAAKPPVLLLVQQRVMLGCRFEQDADARRRRRQ